MDSGKINFNQLSFEQKAAYVRSTMQNGATAKTSDIVNEIVKFSEQNIEVNMNELPNGFKIEKGNNTKQGVFAPERPAKKLEFEYILNKLLTKENLEKMPTDEKQGMLKVLESYLKQLEKLNKTDGIHIVMYGVDIPIDIQIDKVYEKIQELLEQLDPAGKEAFMKWSSRYCPECLKPDYDDPMPSNVMEIVGCWYYACEEWLDRYNNDIIGEPPSSQSYQAQFPPVDEIMSAIANSTAQLTAFQQEKFNVWSQQYMPDCLKPDFQGIYPQNINEILSAWLDACSRVINNFATNPDYYPDVQPSLPEVIFSEEPVDEILNEMHQTINSITAPLDQYGHKIFNEWLDRYSLDCLKPDYNGAYPLNIIELSHILVDECHNWVDNYLNNENHTPDFEPSIPEPILANYEGDYVEDVTNMFLNETPDFKSAKELMNNILPVVSGPQANLTKVVSDAVDILKKDLNPKTKKINNEIWAKYDNFVKVYDHSGRLLRTEPYDEGYHGKF